MKSVEIFENQRASNYNTFVETWIPNYHYFMNNLPNILNDTENKNLLVVGCGTGAEIERFTNTSTSWKVTGIDPSPEMISQAIEKFKNVGNVQLIEGTIDDINSAEKFGAATLLLVLHFIEGIEAKFDLLKSISAKLESNAPFVLLDITGTKQQIKENLKILSHLLPTNLDKEDVKNRLYRIENKLHAISEDQLKEIIVKAGFETPTRFFQNSIYMGWITRKR
ncbi:class I SAM-dependent methyltransferase [uncultured Kordia sp.]|uniref:class I SAM-dependent methyltransferase n=1 Tax=uncultured Kordia sp. TaxID=507699 RepID=UPI002629180E|nr:class I SAM-dependent methyltransferase [uncultured Kordia sp.]